MSSNKYNIHESDHKGMEEEIPNRGESFQMGLMHGWESSFKNGVVFVIIIIIALGYFTC